MSHDHDNHEPEVFEGEFDFTNGKMAMWLFLVSDAMAFIGFLGAYMVLRLGAPTGDLVDRGQLMPWQPAWGPPLEVVLTGFNTFVLICSSVTMVKAFSAAQDGDQRRLKRFLALTMLGGSFFVGFQCYEWSHMIHLGGTVQGMIVPTLDVAMERVEEAGLDRTRLEVARDLFGKRETEGAELPADFTQEQYLALPYVTDDHGTPVFAGVIGLPDYGIPGTRDRAPVNGPALLEMGHDERYAQGARVGSLFCSSFFLLTGFHGLHVFIGVIYLGVVLVRATRGAYGPDRNSPVEVAGLYWHFVDLVWVLLFMLIYLI